MEQNISIFDQWIQENNKTVIKCQELEADVINTSHHHHLRSCSSKFHQLLRQIQGLPAHTGHAHLELVVVFNACLCSAAQAEFSEAERLLSHAADRVLQSEGGDAQTSDLCERWKLLLKVTEKSLLRKDVDHLMCLQWALWLATRQLERIDVLEEVFSALREKSHDGYEDVDGRKSKEKSSKLPRLVTDPRRLVETLHICTVIVQSAERMSDGRSSEALSALQEASTLAAPRALHAHTHLLSGACLSRMGRPQLALQCFKKAVETDSGCVCALYQSALIYGELGNAQEETQALRLLHSMLMLRGATPTRLASSPLLSPALLLSSQSVSSLLSVPSALSVLHTLALKCVGHGRVSEGVEHFLDLLAVLHSEDQHQEQMQSGIQTLPRLPELYLQAGAALLMARRPADCDALCDEVLGATLELLPGGPLLAEPEEQSTEPEEQSAEAEKASGQRARLARLLWSAAAHMLQGHCRGQLMDWKQAVTHYSRAIHLLVKVRFKKTGLQPQIPREGMDNKWEKDMKTLQKLKGLSLSWRGINFAQTNQMKEALRDLHLGLQLVPECRGGGLWCGEVLWRLGRKHEAAARWENTWNSSTPTLDQNLPLYLQEPESGPLLNSAELQHRLQQHGLTKIH